MSIRAATAKSTSALTLARPPITNMAAASQSGGPIEWRPNASRPSIVMNAFTTTPASTPPGQVVAPPSMRLLDCGGYNMPSSALLRLPHLSTAHCPPEQGGPLRLLANGVNELDVAKWRATGARCY